MAYIYIITAIVVGGVAGYLLGNGPNDNSMPTPSQDDMNVSNTHVTQQFEQLERQLRQRPNVFDREAHNSLRHLYSAKNPPDMRKALEHTNVILEHSIMDDYMLNILSGWQIGKDNSAARRNCETASQLFPDLRSITAACLLKIGDLFATENKYKEAVSSYQQVSGDKSAPIRYRTLADEKTRFIQARIPFPYVNKRLTYSGTFTNMKYNVSGTVVIRVTINDTNVATGYIDFTELPGERPLCAAGDFVGTKEGNFIKFGFMDKDDDRGCRGFKLHFNVTGTFSDDNRIISGSYSTWGQNGVFRVEMED